MSSKARRTGSETREQIFIAARRLLEKHGYHGVGLEQVAAAAGVSRQAVYLHFRSKGDLLVELVNHVDATGPLPALVQRVFASGKGLDALNGLAGAQAEYNPLVARLASVIDSARATEPEAAAAWDARMKARWGGCRRVIQMLAAEGLLAEGRGLDEATDLMWALTNIRLWRDLVIDRGWSPTRYTKHLRDLLHAMLLRPASKRRRPKG